MRTGPRREGEDWAKEGGRGLGRGGRARTGPRREGEDGYWPTTVHAMLKKVYLHP